MTADSHDPAIAAARRAWVGRMDGWTDRNVPESMVAAAREMAKPIREQHKPLPNTVSALHPHPLCSCGVGSWKDCPTVRLVYSTEELT